MRFLSEKAQRFGKSFMLPVAVLPATGLLLGISSTLSNPNTIKTYPILDITLLQNVFTLMSAAGSIVFQNLPVIFAIDVATGLSRNNKGIAGLAALLNFLIINTTMDGLLTITDTLAENQLAQNEQGMVLGIQTVKTGVFGGIITGIMAAILRNKYHEVVLSPYSGFFDGPRLVPIVTAFAAIFLGVLMFFVWPSIQAGIYRVDGFVTETGAIGAFVYGFILRLLGPLGLRHIFYLPFWQTALGGTSEVREHLVQGTQNIFFAQFSDPDVTKYYSGVSRFMSGRFITMVFGLCGTAFAIYRTTKPEHKKVVSGLMLSAVLASFLTDITELLEFSFLFVVPVLYIIHAFFDGLAFMMADIFSITIGQTFSGSFIDFLLFGVLQGNSKTSYLYIIPVGIVWFHLHYIVLRFLVTKFNFKTPGREDKTVAQQIEAVERAQTIVAGLRGKDNTEIVDCCTAGLHVTLHQNDRVDKILLESTDAKGVIQQGTGMQVIYEPHVTVIKNEIEELLEG